MGSRRPARAIPIFQERPGHRSHAQAQKVLDLGGEDDDRDSACESGHDGIGDEFDRASETGETHRDQEHSGHQSADGEPVHAVLLDDSVDDHDESAGGAADLNAAASQERDEESGHERGDEALFRGDSRGDRERQSERNRDDSDDQPGQKVVGKLCERVAPQNGEGLGQKKGRGGGLPRRSAGGWRFFNQEASDSSQTGSAVSNCAARAAPSVMSDLI
jgi:hypothetical protein